jgi:uncharacterized phage protein (TIGR02220 family)
MNTDAQKFLKKFSTKKDALVALDELILVTDESCWLGDAAVENFNKYTAIKQEIEAHNDQDLASQVLAYFNETYETHYKNDEKIKSIIRQIPKITFDQFQSVILHKKETWGGDIKMKDYLRPATLFGSKNKFLQYLDDATNYWIQKHKHDRQEKRIVP